MNLKKGLGTTDPGRTSASLLASPPEEEQCVHSPQGGPSQGCTPEVSP